MKVTVIGPGAMGCLFAARLARSGARVHLVDHRADRAARLEKSGISIETATETFVERPMTTTHVPSGQDFILVLTKSHSTSLLSFPPDAPILTLQNGLGNVETLCAMVGSARIIAGSTTEAATMLGEGRIRHSAAGKTIFGAWTSCATAAVSEALSAAGFDATVTDAPGQLIWEKAAINAGINPLTALLDVPNGRLLDLKDGRELMRDLVVEAAKVASTEGYRFPRSLVEAAEETCRQTASNISSMLQDIHAGRQTEIEAISGEILRRAQTASLPTPRTRVVYQLVRSLESR